MANVKTVRCGIRQIAVGRNSLNFMSHELPPSSGSTLDCKIKGKFLTLYMASRHRRWISSRIFIMVRSNLG